MLTDDTIQKILAWDNSTPIVLSPADIHAAREVIAKTNLDTLKEKCRKYNDGDIPSLHDDRMNLNTDEFYIAFANKWLVPEYRDGMTFVPPCKQTAE